MALTRAVRAGELVYGASVTVVTTGASGTRLLQTLASYRLRDGGIDFGMYAEVSTAGIVRRADPVELILQ